LLGPGEYQVNFHETIDGKAIPVPPEVQMTTKGVNWFRYRASVPETANPRLLRALLAADFPVLSLEEVPRSLEQVYLQAVNTPPQEEASNVA